MHCKYIGDCSNFQKQFRSARESLEMKFLLSIGIQKNRRLHFMHFYIKTSTPEFLAWSRRPEATGVCLRAMMTIQRFFPSGCIGATQLPAPEAGFSFLMHSCVPTARLCAHILLGEKMTGTQGSPTSSICSQICKVWIAQISNHETSCSKEKVNCAHTN